MERTQRRWHRLTIGGAAIALAVGLVAACSSSSTESGGGSSGTAGQSPANGTTPPQPDVTIAASGTPKTGGTLRYGLEAETDGFNPTVNRWAISGTQVGLAVYDPLVALDVDGKGQPYLAESLTPSNDYKTWTIKLRSGISFHDGTPLTSAAVKKVFDEHKASALTSASVTPIESVSTTDDLTAVVQMKSPWAVFPNALTGQLGVVPAPSMFDAADKGGRAPVGTGPFKFKDWVPDKQFTAVKNPSYWRKDTSGTQLPYLDEVDFLPLPETQSRVNSLKSGQIEMMHTNDAKSIIDIRKLASEGTIQKVEDTGESEEGFILLNTVAPPFDNLKARQALAYATDTATYVESLDYGVLAPANNVFTPNSPWLVPTDYPSYDPAKAQQLVNEVKAEKGDFKFKISGGGPDTRDNLQALQAMWQAVGMDVEVDIVDQASFIPTAVLGKYQANLWRQFGSPDPDSDYLWWTSENAKPVGELALNMARNKDPELDKGLRIGRENTDFAKRKEGYAIVQQRMAADLPYIWLDHAQWVVAAKNNVRNITNGPLPGGQQSYPIGGSGFPGVTRLTQVWLAS
ncbi:MAG: ABC transporter substrate-binding protein [Acidimicrobiales bacterium]